MAMARPAEQLARRCGPRIVLLALVAAAAVRTAHATVGLPVAADGAARASANAAAPSRALAWPAAPAVDGEDASPVSAAGRYLIVYRAPAPGGGAPSSAAASDAQAAAAAEAAVAEARASARAVLAGFDLVASVDFPAAAAPPSAAAAAASGSGGAPPPPPPPPLRIDVIAPAPGAAAGARAASLRRLRRLPGVAFVEPDGVVRVLNATLTQSSPPSWGLERIDQRALPLDDEYMYPADGGNGTTIYIIDTGIETTHPEFGGRASWGPDFTKESGRAPPRDLHGHGTHCAGTAGGATTGVAKNAALVAVKVLKGKKGQGTISWVVQGLQWAVADCKAARGGRRCVASLSLGSPLNRALNAATNAAVAAGLVVTVAAGNSNANACKSSPAAAPAAVTVGATMSDDSRSSFSNWGPCVDLYAPGSSITSSVPAFYCKAPPCYSSFSGTSMATPHAAGAAALFWAAAAPNATGAAVSAALIAAATPGVVTRTTDAGPLLLYAAP